MEVPFKDYTLTNLTNKLQKMSSNFVDTFTQEDPITNGSSFIMPLYEVEKTLHTHYVNTQPLLVTYEYYDSNNQIKQDSIICTVKSPIRQNQCFELQLHNTNKRFHIPVEQILTVSANIV